MSTDAYMHLHVDPAAKAEAEEIRAAMPKHYFAPWLPSERVDRCAHTSRPGGVKCARPRQHPVHLAPAEPGP